MRPAVVRQEEFHTYLNNVVTSTVDEAVATVLGISLCSDPAQWTHLDSCPPPPLETT
jgi:hypothetical protein